MTHHAQHCSASNVCRRRIRKSSRMCSFVLFCFSFSAPKSVSSSCGDHLLAHRNISIVFFFFFVILADDILIKYLMSRPLRSTGSEYWKHAGNSARLHLIRRITPPLLLYPSVVRVTTLPSNIMF